MAAAATSGGSAASGGAGARDAAYATSAEVDTIEALSRRLTADMRDNIRSLAAHEVMSEAWVTMAEKLARIANISEMEKRIPRTKADATLWEGEELALRYLLEDGKLNLSLRLLDEYLRYLARADEAGTRITGDVALRCARFEFGAGVMLGNAWMHKEALHTTDLPLLAALIVTIANRALVAPPIVTCITAAPAPAVDAGAAGGAGGGAAVAAAAAAPLTATTTVSVAGLSVPKRALESIMLTFVAGAGKHATGLYERRVIAEFIKTGVFDALALHLHTNHARLDDGDILAGCEGLAALFGTEEYVTAKARAFTRPGSAAAMAALKADFLDRLLAPADAAMKRRFRPLLDAIADAARRK